MSRFCDRYQIDVLDQNKRYRSAIAPVFHTSAISKDIMQTAIQTYEEKLLTITIPESKLERLIEFERIFFNDVSGPEVRNAYGVMRQQKQEEKRIRESSAAVKNAFEEYSLLLHLYGYKESFPL